MLYILRQTGHDESDLVRVTPQVYPCVMADIITNINPASC